MRGVFPVLIILLVLLDLGRAGDICPHLNVQPCANIDSNRPRTCTACIGVTIDQPSVAYLYQGQKKNINCILHGLFSNNPSGKWTGTDSKSATTDITTGVTETTDTTQGTKTTTLALTVGDEDMTYSCKYTATDGFSVEDYVIHQIADAASTKRCEVSSDGDYFNKFWGFTDKTDIISSADTGYSVSFADPMMSLILDEASTWAVKQTYRCSASFVSSTGAYKSIQVKAAHIVESSLAAVVWAGEASTINLKLASVNPAAESVIMNFGTNVIAGSLTSDLYTASGALTLDSSAEKIWTISAEFKYPSETKVTIYEDYQLYVATLETPKKYVCFAGEDCDITITFSLSTIAGITSNGQICDFKTNSTDKKTVSWKYESNKISATTTLKNVSYNDAYNTYSWTFYLQNNTQLSMDTKLDVAEIVAKDLTVFDAFTQTVTYQFEIKGADVSPTACYTLMTQDGQPDQKRTGTLAGNVCTVTGAQVEAQSEYSYTCVFEINGQTLQQKVSTDFIVLEASPNQPVVNVTGADVTLACTAKDYKQQPTEVSWDCTGEWCEHASKNLQTKLGESEYTDLHKAQDACAANQACTGVTKEVRNGITKYYLMSGSLTSSAEDDTSWVSGTCAEDHSGWISIIADCYQSTCALPFELGKHQLQVKYAAQNDQEKYVNFFDKDKTRIGFIKWSLNPGKIQIYDCSNAEELSWDKTPPTSTETRTWTITKTNTHIKLSLGDEEMFSYEYKDEAKCKALYEKDIMYVSFNEFLSKTTAPQYLNVGNENQDVPKTIKNETVAISTYTKSNLTRDTSCTCTFKFNDISTLTKTFKIYEAQRLTPNAYYSLQKTEVEPACSFSVEYSALEGTVQWIFKDEVIKNEAFTKTRFEQTDFYNISSSLGLTALQDETSALVTCKFLFTNEPTITWTVAVGKVEFPVNELVFSALTTSLSYNCTIIGSDADTKWTYYRSFSGGEEKKLDNPAWTEDSWGLTDYTLKCRAELPSQNLTTLYVVDRTETVTTPTIKTTEEYIQVWMHEMAEISIEFTQLIHTPTGASYVCKDADNNDFPPKAGQDDTSTIWELQVPTSKMKRRGIWKDVTCTYTLKFKNSEVSVPFKVDVYGMSNITKVTTAGSALEVSLSTYGLKDVSNVNISWNLAGSVDNKTEGYTSTVTKNTTGVTSTLKVAAIPVEKHGSHNITVSTNGGDAIATLQLYVIDINRKPHPSVLQRKGFTANLICDCINWKDNATIAWNQEGTITNKFSLSSIESTYIANFAADTKVSCQFTFPESVVMSKEFNVDVFEMSDVSKEAIAHVKSTLKVEFPISGLQDFGAATKSWTYNGTKHIIPATYWKDVTECDNVQCSTAFNFEYISLDVKLNYDTTATKKIHFYSEELKLMGTLSWTDYKDLILTGYNNALSWTNNPGYSAETTVVEWHIQITNQSRLVIMSPDENTKYLDFDLKVGGECTSDMCNKKTARVAFQGFTGHSAKIYDFLVQDRHYIEQTSTTGNTGGVYTLTVADIVGKDRGSIPITVTGADKLEHTANINIYVIEFEGGDKMSFTHQKGVSLKLTAKISGWLTKPSKVDWYTDTSPITETIETTHGDSTSQSILTHTFTDDKVVYCKYTIGDLTAIKTFYLDTFELVDKTALALVGQDVQFNFTIPGVANESAVDITWKWNGLSGNVNEQGANSVSEWKDITCGCTSASCTCPDTMNIVTYDVLVQQPTTVVARSDNWRTVVFYTETDTWITYISWNDQKSKVKTKCKNTEHDVVLPAAKDNIREYKIDINSTHLTLYCQDKIIASDPADCDDDFVPNKWMSIAKVGFNSDLMDDGAKKMIKKDDRVHVKKTSYNADTDTFFLQLSMQAVRPDDSGDVELSVKDNQDHGLTYTSHVKVIYSSLTFEDVRLVSDSKTVPDVTLQCDAKLNSNQDFKISLMCNKTDSVVLATHSATSSTGHVLSHVLQSLKTDSCLEYKCLLEVVGQSVSDYNEVAVLYHVATEKWLVNEGWTGKLNTSANYIGKDENLKKSCTWNSKDKNYASTFTMVEDKVSCTVDFTNVTVKDTAVIDVTGFEIGPGKQATTQATLHVGSVNTSVEIGINQIASPTVFCNVTGLDQTAAVSFNVNGAQLSTSVGDTGRTDKWEITETYKDDTYPVCTYTIPGYLGQLTGTVKLYVIDADLVSIAGLGANATGRITCNLHHDVLDIDDQSFSWMVNNTKVEDGTPNMKVISDYEGAKHNDHWYNASSTLILLDVKKEMYEFHCFMSFHQDTHLNYSESLDPIWITPDHTDYDSEKDAIIKYNIPQKCDSNFVINKTIYTLFNEFHNVSSYHLSNVKVESSYVDAKTYITTTMTDITTASTGYYYHLCGVDYTVTKAGKESKVTEYLFLPFHMNIIDLITIGTYPQSKDHPTDLFFRVTHLAYHVSTVTVSFGTDKTVETVHDYKVGDEKKIAGPYNSTLTIKKDTTELLVYVTVPPNQKVGAKVICDFLIGSETFSREAALGDFYGYTTKDQTYTMSEEVNVSLTLSGIPTNNATFSLEAPFNARAENFTLDPTYQDTDKKTSLGDKLYDCVLKIKHNKSSLALAGYYVINVTVPAEGLYRQFQIDTKVGVSIVETEKVEITMISESSTTAAVKLVDYSELDLIKITGLTWTPALPASFVVSDIVKNGRSHEATVKINSVPTAAAGTYKFSFALETGETYSANLVVNVIEKTVNTSSREVCAAETYTNQIYGTLVFPDTKSGDTATVACYYNSMTVTEDVATRKCVNGTWQSVNQTLCGSAETAELQEIYKAATASVSGSENTVAENFKMQIEYMQELKTFCKKSITKLSGSDLEGVNTIVSTVSNGSTFYEESASVIVDILDTIIEGAAEDAVSIYSISELSLRNTAVNLGMTLLKNNTATTKTFKGSKMTLLTTPAESTNTTTIETTVSDKSMTISLPDKSGMFASSVSSPGFIVAVYSEAADIFQTENTASSVISPAVEIELSDHSQDTSNLTEPLQIFFELNEKIPDVNGIAAVYYDTTNSTWSTEGCKTNITSNTTVTAICYHLSAFAIQYTNAEYVDEVSIHQTKFGGVGVSLLFLCVALILLLVHRVPRQDQIVQTHVWLVGTMVAANLFLTIAVNVKDSSLGAGCSVVGFLANMSWIAVHMWVLVEGILMNQIVNEGYTYRVDKQFVRFAGFSFGIATFIALIGAIVMSVTGSYVNEAQDICWLDGPALLFFMWLPIVVLSLITLALLLKSFIFLKQNEHKHFTDEVVIIKKTIVAVLVLLILLDIGWVFAGVAGATTLDPSLAKIQTYCNVLYIVLNVFQGVAVVVLFCIFNPKVMGAWKNMRNPTPDAEQGEEKVVEEVELEVPVEVPAEEVSQVDDTDMRSRRSAYSLKSGRSARSARSARSTPRTVGEAMSAVAAPAVQSTIVEEEHPATEPPKKKKKKKKEDVGEDAAEGEGEGATKSKKSKKKAASGENNEAGEGDGEAPKKKKKKKPPPADAGEDGEGAEPSAKPKKKKKKPETESKEDET